MGLLTLSSPHTHGPNSTGKVMATVALACLPGIAVMTAFFGWGTLINLALAIATALTSEALIVKIRRRPVSFFLKDNSDYSSEDSRNYESKRKYGFCGFPIRTKKIDS